MPVSEKQRRAACAELNRRLHGGGMRNFRGMGIRKLREWCRARRLDRKGRKK